MQLIILNITALGEEEYEATLLFNTSMIDTGTIRDDGASCQFNYRNDQTYTATITAAELFALCANYDDKTSIELTVESIDDIPIATVLYVEVNRVVIGYEEEAVTYLVIATNGEIQKWVVTENLDYIEALSNDPPARTGEHTIGTLSVTNDTTVGGDTELQGELNVAEDVTFQKTLEVAESVSVPETTTSTIRSEDGVNMYIKPGDADEGDGLDNVIEAGDTEEGTGGALPLKAGDSTAGDGGEASLRGGDAGGEGDGGEVIIKGGTGGTIGNGGATNISGGDALAESDGDGGDLTLDAGTGDGEGDNGDINFGLNTAGINVGTAGFISEDTYRAVFLSPTVDDVEGGSEVVLSVETYRSNLTADEEGSTATLPSGVIKGQVKKLIIMDDGDFVVTYNGGTTVSFTTKGQFIILMWSGLLWYLYDYGTHDPDCPTIEEP